MSQTPMPPAVPGPRVPPPMPNVSLNYRAGDSGIDGAAWHAMGRLCACDQAILPERCIKCNSTEDVRMKRKQFTWVPSWVYITILAGLLVAIILSAVLQKKATITYGLCAVHRRKRLNRVWISLGTLGFSIMLFVLAGVLEQGLLVALGILVILGLLIYIALTGSVLKPQKIDRGIIELTGCGPEFLSTLPNSQYEV